MKRRLPLKLAIALALALLGGVGWQWHRNRNALIQLDHWENYTYSVKLQLQELRSALTDAETGQRGFLLSGNEGYLQAYNQALGQVNQSLASLRTLTRDNPRQQKRLDVLQPLVRDKLAELKQTIDLRRTEGLEAASRVVATYRGQSLMERIRQLTDQAQAEETRLVQQRGQAKQAELRATSFTALTGGLLSAALLLTALLLLNRREDSTLYHEEMGITPLGDEHGTAAHYIAIKQEMTKHKRAEVALRQSEERYRSLFNSLDEGFCVIELLFDQHHQPVDYRFLETNPAFERHSGMRNPTGKTARQFAPNLEKRWFELFGQVALTGRPARYSDWSQPLQRWFEGYAVRVGQPEQHQVAILFTDVTGPKRAEEALRENETRLRLAVETAELGTYERDLLTNELRLNEVCREILGVATPSLPPDIARQAVHPQDKERVLAAVTRAFDPGLREICAAEFRILRPDGTVRWVAGRGRVLFDEAVSPAQPRKFLGVLNDITERKRAEDALQQSERAARARAEELSTFLETVPAFTFLAHDPECRRMSTSRITRQLLRLPEGANPSKSAPEAERPATFRVVKDGREVPPEQLPMQLAAATAREVRDAELTFLFEDGTTRQLFGNAVPLFDDSGKVRGAIGAFVDITERKRAEEALRKSEERLARDLQAMTRLQEVSALFVREANLQPALEQIVDAAIAISGADFGNIQLLDRASCLRIVVQRGFPQWYVDYWNQVTAGHGSCGTALGRAERVIVPDVEQSPIFAGTPGLEMQRRAGVRAVQSTPILSRSGEPIGMFSTHFKTPHRPDERVLKLLDLLARQAADILERAQAEQALQRRTLHLQLLHQAAARLLVGQQAVELLRQLHAQIARAFGADAFTLYQVDHPGGRLHLVACAGVSEEEKQKLETLRYGRAVCARPVEALQPIIATHLQDREGPNRRFVRKLGFRSYLYYPLILNNHLHGTVAFASRTRDDYDPSDLDFFHTVASTLAEALERERLQTELQRHATDLEETVQERTAKLRETITELEGFSYALIHDMRAPLRAMQSYVGIVQEEAAVRLRPEEIELLGRIRIASKRMDHLITDSLNYTRILRQNLPLVPVNLGGLLRNMVETYPNFHAPQADVVIDFGDLLVQGNEAALTQIFSHLLGNAVKFVAPGVRPVVRVWAETKDAETRGCGEAETGRHGDPETGRHGDRENLSASSVRVFIQDNGIGIPKEAHGKIFGMFQRLHREDQYPGTGIGLALVRKSLERLGGAIHVDSEPGQGSTFCVELPSVPVTTPSGETSHTE